MKQVCIWDKFIKGIADGAMLLAVNKEIKTQIPDTKITMFAMHGGWIDKRPPQIKTPTTDQMNRVLAS